MDGRDQEQGQSYAKRPYVRTEMNLTSLACVQSLISNCSFIGASVSMTTYKIHKYTPAVIAIVVQPGSSSPSLTRSVDRLCLRDFVQAHRCLTPRVEAQWHPRAICRCLHLEGRTTMRSVRPCCDARVVKPDQPEFPNPGW